MHGTRGAGLLQPTGEAVRCRSHLATSNSFGARAPARGTPRSVLSALASLAQRSRSRAVGAVASDAPAHVPLDGVEGQHYEREGEGDAEAELPLHVEAERGEDVADRLVEVRLVRLERQAEERLVPTPVEPRTHAAREEQTAAQAGLGGGDDLLELPRKVDEERLGARLDADGQPRAKLCGEERRDERQEQLAHIVLDKLAAREGEVYCLCKLDAQHALHREPADVETAQRRGQPLRVAHRTGSHTHLALEQLRGRDLVHIGDAVAVLVLRVVLGLRLRHRHRLLVDVLQLLPRRAPAGHVECLRGRD
mmetsp:Transcript_39587/g.127225  ORF Transcript_39587/g.127225 Transcript_39587/m.127225 type:complete len:308 (-) Transcript_39587:411-1334(-)